MYDLKFNVNFETSDFKFVDNPQYPNAIGEPVEVKSYVKDIRLDGLYFLNLTELKSIFVIKKPETINMVVGGIQY